MVKVWSESGREVESIAETTAEDSIKDCDGRGLVESVRGGFKELRSIASTEADGFTTKRIYSKFRIPEKK